MAVEDACEHDMLVQIHWQGREVAIPLSQLDAIGADESTHEAIGDWHHGVALARRHRAAQSARYGVLNEVDVGRQTLRVPKNGGSLGSIQESDSGTIVGHEEVPVTQLRKTDAGGTPAPESIPDHNPHLPPRRRGIYTVYKTRSGCKPHPRRCGRAFQSGSVSGAGAVHCRVRWASLAPLPETSGAVTSSRRMRSSR